MLAGPGTPRDPKSHLFVINRVAIQPFCKPLRPADAEFRRGSRQIGLTPSISTFFDHFLDQKSKKVVFWQEKNAPARNAAVALEGLEANPANRGPRGPMWRLLGAIPPHMGPWGPMWRPGGAFPPQKGPGALWGPGAPLGPRAYIGKLPINRTGGVYVHMRSGRPVRAMYAGQSRPS